MKIRLETDYAIRICCYLASFKKGTIKNIRSISEECKITKAMVLKIVNKLIKSGYILSHRGKNGGYSLNVDSDILTLKDIIESLQGKISINTCLCIQDPYCSRGNIPDCKVHKKLLHLQNYIEDYLENIKISEVKYNKKIKLRRKDENTLL